LLKFFVGRFFGHTKVFLWYWEKVLLQNKRVFGNALSKVYSFFSAIWRPWYLSVQTFAFPHGLLLVLTFLFFIAENKTDNSVVKGKKSSMHLLPSFLGYS